jgi:hypothetical protein
MLARRKTGQGTRWRVAGNGEMTHVHGAWFLTSYFEDKLRFRNVRGLLLWTQLSYKNDEQIEVIVF